MLADVGEVRTVLRRQVGRGLEREVALEHHLPRERRTAQGRGHQAIDARVEPRATPCRTIGTGALMRAVAETVPACGESPPASIAAAMITIIPVRCVYEGMAVW